MNQYLSLVENEKVDGMFWFEELPEEVTLGPIIVTNPAVVHGRGNCVINPTPFSEFPSDAWPAGPTPTSALYWSGSGPVWVETSPVTFAQRRQNAVNKCLVDVDLVTTAAVGARGKEYVKAEIAARAYKSANYTGDVHSYVSSYALYNPTRLPQSNQWAADVIIARADAFEAAEEALRTERFRLQHGMYGATNDAELAAPVAEWNGFINGLRAQLGI